VSPPTAAVKFKVFVVAEPSGVSSIVRIPVTELSTIEIIKPLPPPQPENSIKATLARPVTAANRILFMPPPKFP
jgi:hypothetical protein